jgi:hypothetical protein
MFFGVFELVYGENNRPDTEIRKKLKTEAECKN